MANKPGYFKQYYDEKKDEILDRRRKRYQEDPEYRETALNASRAYREDQRKTPRIKIPRYQRPMVGTTSDGREVRLFSVGAFSAYLGRSIQALNHWEKTGLLPRTPYTDPRGFRFYTEAMMRAVKEEVNGKRRLYPHDPEMAKNIRDRWVASGVPLDEENGMEAALKATVLPSAE